MLKACKICPHNCGIDRTNGQTGWCKSKDTVKIGLYSTHNFEEPCISGKKGSGTIFFAEIFLKQQEKKCRKYKFSNTYKLCITNN